MAGAVEVDSTGGAVNTDIGLSSTRRVIRKWALGRWHADAGAVGGFKLGQAGANLGCARSTQVGQDGEGLTPGLARGGVFAALMLGCAEVVERDAFAVSVAASAANGERLTAGADGFLKPAKTTIGSAERIEGPALTMAIADRMEHGGGPSQRIDGVSELCQLAERLAEIEQRPCSAVRVLEREEERKCLAEVPDRFRGPPITAGQAAHEQSASLAVCVTDVQVDGQRLVTVPRGPAQAVAGVRIRNQEDKCHCLAMFVADLVECGQCLLAMTERLLRLTRTACGGEGGSRSCLGVLAVDLRGGEGCAAGGDRVRLLNEGLHEQAGQRDGKPPCNRRLASLGRVAGGGHEVGPLGLMPVQRVVTPGAAAATLGVLCRSGATTPLTGYDIDMDWPFGDADPSVYL